MAFTVGNENRDIFSRLRKMTPIKRIEMFDQYKSQAGGSTPFSMLTPEQFAELFPKYYMQKLPDVGGFFKALSSKKELGGEGQTYGPHGNTTGTASATPASSERITNTVKAKEIYDYIRSKGVDHNHAVGIINNMKYESAFNSGAEHVDNNGLMSGGLFQHNGTRYKAMTEYVGADWKTNWKKQIDFAMTEGDMKKYLAIDYSNATDASKGFTSTFERPWQTEKTAAYRAGTAEGYGTAMSQSGPSTTSGGNFETTSSGFIVPKDKTLYSPGNEQQCATLAKGLNPEIGRSSGWTVVPGDIKPGMTVATMRYNLPGGDRTGSGYHSGVAMSAPDKDGNFLLLEQFNGQPARVRKVNLTYGGGAMGGTTQFGLISSNGKLHTEQSLEALNYGARLAPDEESKKIITGNHDAVTKGETTGSQQGTGSVSVNQQEAPAGVPGPQTNLQQQETVKSIQTASIGDMMRMAGDMAGFFMRGEGMGGSPKKHVRAAQTNGAITYNPNVVSTGLNAGSSLVDYVGDMITKAIGLTKEQFNAMRQAKASIESSGGKYDLRGGSSKRFAGAYQMGGAEIIDAARRLGIEAPVVKAKSGKVVASDQFLKDPHLQERLHESFVIGQHERLMKNKIYAGLPPEEKASTLMIAHNAGAGGASKYLRTGQAKKDAFGTRPEQYAGHFKRQLQGLQSSQTAAAPPSPPTQAQQKIQTAGPAPTPAAPTTATVAPAPKSKIEQAYGKVKGFFEGQTSTAQEVQRNNYSDVAGRLRQLKTTQQPLAPEPVPTGGMDFDTPETRQRLEQESTRDKQSFNMSPATPPQRPVTIDAFNDRPANKMPSESLARAMMNTKDPIGANKDHDFMTSVGSFG